MSSDNPSAPVQPTPAQLAEQVRSFDSAAPDADDQMKQIIRDAENGGDAHKKAVVDALFGDKTSDGERAASVAVGPPSVYDTATGQPAFHESNVLLEMRVRINGRLCTARATLDPYVYDVRFDGDQFEEYIRHFIQSNCGRMATDPENYAHFRSLVTVTHPQDQHDLRRCADGWQATPYCDRGLISKAPHIHPAVDGAIVPPASREDVLGTCPCRCHRRNGTADHLRLMAQAYNLPTFDEDMLDENGFLR